MLEAHSSDSRGKGIWYRLIGKQVLPGGVIKVSSLAGFLCPSISLTLSLGYLVISVSQIEGDDVFVLPKLLEINF